MAWFSKQKKVKAKESTPSAPPAPAAKGEGIWYKCDACENVVARAEWEKAWNVCPSCGQHDALPLRRRLDLVLDPGSFQELDAELTPQDPLGFVDSKRYRDRLRSTRKASTLRDAFIDGVGAIGGGQVSIGCFAFEFMGGSMGSVVGEKVARVFDRAYERRIPAIVFSSTGGARMQEGIFSLSNLPAAV